MSIATNLLVLANEGNSPGNKADTALVIPGCSTDGLSGSQLRFSRDSSQGDTSVPMGEDGDVDSDDDQSGYVRSSAPSQTQSPASTPGSEFPYSLASDNDADNLSRSDAANGPATQQKIMENTTGSREGPDTTASQSLSQDGFEIIQTLAAPGMSQQLPTFLLPFQRIAGFSVIQR